MQKYSYTKSFKSSDVIARATSISKGKPLNVALKFPINITQDQLSCLYSINIPKQKMSFYLNYEAYKSIDEYYTDSAIFYLPDKTLMASSISNGQIDIISLGRSENGSDNITVSDSTDTISKNPGVKFANCKVSINDNSSNYSNFENLEFEFNITISSMDSHGLTDCALQADGNFTITIDFYYFG